MEITFDKLEAARVEIASALEMKKVPRSGPFINAELLDLRVPDILLRRCLKLLNQGVSDEKFLFVVM